jgi:hypothetical protein
MTTKEEREQAPAYIGRRPCGCIGFATVDDPKYAKDNAKEIAKVIKLGWTVERVTVQFVRENWGPGCEQCDKKKTKVTKKAVNQEALPL